jgi:hypothetical protein
MNEINTNNSNPEPIEPIQSTPAQPVQPEQLIQTLQSDQMPLEEPTFKMKLARFYQDNKWPIWIIILSFLVMGAFLFFTFHKNGPGAGTPKVELSIDAPQEAASGSEIVYKINFANHDSQGIRDAVIDITYPTGFTYTDSSPASTKINGSQFKVPALDPSQDGTIMIKGTLIGDLDEGKTINAIMHFSFANFNSDFIVQAQGQTKIINSDVNLQFDGPFEATNDQDIIYHLTYKNSTDKDISNLKLSIDTPQSFVLKSFNPTPDSGNVWRITTLHPGDTKVIEISGAFKDAKQGDQQILSAKIEGVSDNGDSYVLTSAQYSVNISGTPITLLMKMQNQSSASTQVVNPGDSLTYTVHYQNNSSSTQSGINIIATILGESYDLSTLRSDDATIQGNVLTWNGSQVSGLNNLQANQGGDLIFTVKLKNPATSGNATKITLTARSKVTSNSFSQGFPSNDITSKVATLPAITSSVNYASGTTPLLPSQRTVFNVTIDLSNSTNDLTSSVLSFNLPNTSDFSKSTVNAEEQANVTYDKNTHKLIWNLGKLAAHVGENGKSPRRLSFQASVTPALSNVGRDVVLVNNLKLTGTDDFTGLQISVAHENITTNDDKAGNRFVVGQ